jgi:uncharacterized protein
MALLALVLLFQLQIPQPVGYVNDFAGVIRPDIQARMQMLIDAVRQASRGEIVVVTMRDLGGRSPVEAGLQIGRTWGVGARGGAGDSARNAGVILLLKPGERPGDGRSDIGVVTGRGSRFITDARAGQIRDAVGRRAVEAGALDEGLLLGVELLAAAYAREFGFELTASAPGLGGPHLLVAGRGSPPHRLSS